MCSLSFFYWWCCQPMRPMMAIPRALCWQAASSKRGLAASKEAGRSSREHRDLHLLRFLARAFCSPDYACPFQPGCFLPCCSRSPMVPYLFPSLLALPGIIHHCLLRTVVSLLKVYLVEGSGTSVELHILPTHLQSGSCKVVCTEEWVELPRWKKGSYTRSMATHLQYKGAERRPGEQHP